MKANMCSSKLVSMVLAISMCAASVAFSATTAAWGGGSGSWVNGFEWAGGAAPNVGVDDTAVISGGYVEYVAGDDFIVNGAINMTGGVFEQTGGVSWMHIGNAAGAVGVVSVANAVFNMGTSGRNRFGIADRTAEGRLNVSGNGSIISPGELLLQNGFVTLNDFAKLDGSTLTLENGAFNAKGASEAMFSGNLNIIGQYSSLTVADNASVTGLAVTVNGGTLAVSENARLDCATFGVSYAGTVARISGGFIDVTGIEAPVIKDCRFIMTGGELRTNNKTITFGSVESAWEHPPALRGGIIDAGSGELKFHSSCMISGTDIYAKILSMDNVDNVALTLNSGSVTLEYDAQHFGFWAGGQDSYISFVSGGAGHVVMRGATKTDVINNLLSSKIRFDGAVSPHSFILTETSEGVEISVPPAATLISIL